MGFQNAGRLSGHRPARHPQADWGDGGAADLIMGVSASQLRPCRRRARAVRTILAASAATPALGGDRAIRTRSPAPGRVSLLIRLAIEVRALDQHLAQGLAAAPDEPEEFRSAAGRRLTWHEAEPGGGVTTASEGPGRAHRCDERGGIPGPDTGDVTRRRARSSACAGQRAPRQVQVSQQKLAAWADRTGGASLGSLQLLVQLGVSLWGHDARPEKKGADLVQERGALRHQPSAEAIALSRRLRRRSPTRPPASRPTLPQLLFCSGRFQPSQWSWSVSSQEGQPSVA